MEPDADDPSLVDRALGRAAFEAVTIGKDLAAGVLESSASFNDRVSANAFGLIDSAAQILHDATGLPKVEAFKKAELYFRGLAATDMEWSGRLGGGRVGIASRVNRIVGGLPINLGTAAIAAKAGGPVGGFAALGALSESDRGPQAAALGAIEGAAIGVFFRGTETFSKLARGGTLAALGTKMGLSRGETPDEAALQGATLGILAGVTAKGPGGPRLRAERPVEPGAVRTRPPRKEVIIALDGESRSVRSTPPRTEAEHPGAARLKEQAPGELRPAFRDPETGEVRAGGLEHFELFRGKSVPENIPDSSLGFWDVDAARFLTPTEASARLSKPARATRTGVKSRVVRAAGEPRPVRLLKPEDGKPAEIKMPGEEIVEVTLKTPEAVAAERTLGKANEFLGRDYSDLELPSHAINLNLSKITGEADFKRALVQLTEVYKNEINEARRNVVTHEQTAKLADELGLTVEQMLAGQKGQALNAHELLATRRLNVQILKDWHAAGEKIRTKKATDADKVEFLRLTALAEGSLAKTEGATAEAGRALDALKMTAGPSTREMREMGEAIRDFRGKPGESLEAFAEMVAELDTPEGLAGFARHHRKANFGDKLMEVWINFLLSGPQTHMVNIASNTIVAVSASPEAYIAGMYDAVRSGASVARGKGPVKDRVFIREGTARLFGVVEGSREGLVLAAKTMVGKNTMLDPATKLEQQRYRSIGGLKGSAIRLPGRALMAGDELFKSIAKRQEINALAMRTGLQKGLSGRALARHTVEFKKNPPEWATESALKVAREQTFTSSLGEQGTGAQKLFSRPAGKIIVPFVRVTTNILKHSARRTPLGLGMESVRKDLKAGGAKRSAALARIAYGSSIAAWVASESMKGNVTGSGPSDPDLRKMWFAAGYRPYAWRVPREIADRLGMEGDPNQDAFISYARMEPWGTIFGIAADYTQIAGHIEQNGAEDIATEIAFAMGRNITSKTFLMGVANAALAASDMDRYGERFFQRLAGTVVPTGVAQIARVDDPVLREVRTTLDQIKSRIPGYSDTLEARRNWRGEAIMTDPGYGPDILSPLYTHRAEPDESSKEMFRLGVGLRLPQRKVGGVELTPREYTQLQKETGEFAGRAIDVVVNAPHYRAPQVTDGMRVKWIKDAYTQAKEDGRALALVRISVERQLESQLDKLAPLLR